MYSELCQISKMKLFVKIVNGWKLLTIFTKTPSKLIDRVLNLPLSNIKISCDLTWCWWNHCCSLFHFIKAMFLFYELIWYHVATRKFHSNQFYLTLSWRRPLSYRNQSIDLRSKSVDWFLYDNGLRHERVKQVIKQCVKYARIRVFSDLFFLCNLIREKTSERNPIFWHILLTEGCVTSANKALLVIYNLLTKIENF